MLADGDVAAPRAARQRPARAGTSGEDLRAHRRRPAALRPAHLRRPGHLGAALDRPRTAARRRWPRSPPRSSAGWRSAARPPSARPATTRSPGPRRSPARCPSEGYAASASAIASGGQLCQHHCPVAHVAEEFPQLCEAETQVISRLVGTHVQRLATIANGDGVCTTHIPAPPARDRQAAQPPPRGCSDDRAETSLSQAEQLADLGRYEYGWADLDTAGANARRGLNEDVVRDISAKKNEPEWMLDLRLKGLRLFGRKPMPAWGADLSAHRLRQHQVLRALDREAGGELGRPAGRHQEHLRPAGHPRGGEAAPRRRRGRAVRVRSGLSQDPGGPGAAGRAVPGHRHRAQAARGPLPRVLQHGDPGRRQQVRRAEHRGVERWVVHLRAQGRQRGDPAAGLLPDQHREHGPVRADADHRRRGRLRALRRGLHRADLLVATRCTARSSRSS